MTKQELDDLKEYLKSQTDSDAVKDLIELQHEEIMDELEADL